MKFSIVTVTIDSDERLKQTIDSVSCQDYPDVEHIIVDGLNPDSRHLKIGHNHLHLPPCGVYQSINYGIAHAGGDIIGLVHGADRLASPDILSAIAKVFRENPEIDFIYGDIRFTRASDNRPGRIYNAHGFKPSQLQYGMAPPHPSLYIRREVARRIGPYCEDLRLTADMDMWMRLFGDKSLKSAYLPRVITYMSTGGLSSSWKARLISNNVEKLKTLKRNGYPANPFKLLGKYFIILRYHLFDRK